MVKGWRTKPEWIAHYSEVQRKRSDMRMQRFQMEWESQRISNEIEDLIRQSENARKGPCVVFN
jgi:hypothetical protein